jgi:hypothetical protein
MLLRNVGNSPLSQDTNNQGQDKQKQIWYESWKNFLSINLGSLQSTCPITFQQKTLAPIFRCPKSCFTGAVKCLTVVIFTCIKIFIYNRLQHCSYTSTCFCKLLLAVYFVNLHSVLNKVVFPWVVSIIFEKRLFGHPVRNALCHICSKQELRSQRNSYCYVTAV